MHVVVAVYSSRAAQAAQSPVHVGSTSGLRPIISCEDIVHAHYCCRYVVAAAGAYAAAAVC
jgi:hypothetical protein